jgi:hypothetical protein
LNVRIDSLVAFPREPGGGCGAGVLWSSHIFNRGLYVAGKRAPKNAERLFVEVRRYLGFLFPEDRVCSGGGRAFDYPKRYLRRYGARYFTLSPLEMTSIRREPDAGFKSLDGLTDLIG